LIHKTPKQTLDANRAFQEKNRFATFSASILMIISSFVLVVDKAFVGVGVTAAAVFVFVDIIIIVIDSIVIAVTMTTTKAVVGVAAAAAAVFVFVDIDIIIIVIDSIVIATTMTMTKAVVVVVARSVCRDLDFFFAATLSDRSEEVDLPSVKICGRCDRRRRF